ncbi:MAG: hypothetical protein CUN56_00250 [Phototrophicales bacterium]|nr:MAG: hypothetical protein CUN56_00250 [Phototrophicales bacterium]
MSKQSIKAIRQVLRRVQSHLIQSHLNLGAQLESVGFVDVIYHQTSTLPHLNYITPRQKTAWIPTPEIEKGLNQLREHGRTPRVYYIEGLFPPLFAKALHDLDLKIEREIPIMTCALQPPSPKLQPLPDGIRIERVTDQEGIAQWWYVWRNARFDVITGGVEPLYVGRDMRELIIGNQADFILYRYGFPVGVARLTINNQSANLTALSIMKEARTEENVRLLRQAAQSFAIERGCDLIFTSGETEADRRLCRQMGFVDSGSVVCYAQTSQQEETHDMAESTFMLF